MRICRKLICCLLLLLAVSCNKPPIPTTPNPTLLPDTSTPFLPAFTFSPVPFTPSPSPSPSPTSTLTPILFEKGPYLVIGNDPSQMTILWQDRSASGSVEWGLDEGYASGRIAGKLVAEDGLQEAVLTGLPLRTKIYYRVVANGGAATGSFLTPPAAGSTDPLTLWVYGDTRSGIEIQNAIAEKILEDVRQHPLDQTLILFTGDLMDTADESNLQTNLFDPQWTELHQLLSEIPMIDSRGNHDGTQIMNKYFPYPFVGNYYWSLDYGQAHIAVVDQYADLSEYSPQLRWLKVDLDSTSQPWKVILLHRPGWSAGPHENDLVVQKLIHPMAYHAGVHLVLAGHNHYYARALVDGIQYITSGGGGAPLYDPVCSAPNMVLCKKDYHYLKMVFEGNKLTVTALTPEGVILDEFTLTR